MSRFSGSYGNTQVQTGVRCERDSTPLSAHMCETDPHVSFPPLKIVGIDVLSIGIEYLQEQVIGEMIDRQVWQPLRVLEDVLTSGTSVGGSWESHY